MILEDANLTVPSIDAAVRFLTTAFPEFHIRGDGIANGRRWVHVGTDDTYIALTESSESRTAGGALNHLGYVVEDLDALADRMLAAGYREGFIALLIPIASAGIFTTPMTLNGSS